MKKHLAAPTTGQQSDYAASVRSGASRRARLYERNKRMTDIPYFKPERTIKISLMLERR
jgi:hypothetical protein